MSKTTKDIDPQSDETVVFYTGDKVVPAVPARDLHGGDLARIAYVRSHQATDWDARDEAGNPPSTPRPATAHALAKLADELVDTGAYRHTKPDKPVSIEEPAAPVEG